MHEDDRSLLSKKEQEELRLSKEAKPYERATVVEMLGEFRATKPVNDAQRQDIERCSAWVDRMLRLEEETGLVPSWNALIGQMGLCRGRWKKWNRYGDWVEPVYFVVRFAEESGNG